MVNLENIFGKIKAIVSASKEIAFLINFFASKLLFPKGGFPINSLEPKPTELTFKKSALTISSDPGSISIAITSLICLEKLPFPALGSIIESKSYKDIVFQNEDILY